MDGRKRGKAVAQHSQLLLGVILVAVIVLALVSIYLYFTDTTAPAATTSASHGPPQGKVTLQVVTPQQYQQLQENKK